ncbi:MAG: hypothetical protein FWH10_00040 [Oscillospiraceae bacterium]|nr:hypothetical protein [Oscillospiraceae bacterium]
MSAVKIFEMEYEPDFEKNLNRLVKKKKFSSLPGQIRKLEKSFERGEFEGDRMTHRDFPTPHDVYKLRLPNPDTNVGKSNGYRVIYTVVTEFKLVVFLTIYYKKEMENVSDEYVKGLIDGYFPN